MTAQSISGRAPAYAWGTGKRVGGYFSRPPSRSTCAIATSRSSTPMSMWARFAAGSMRRSTSTASGSDSFSVVTR